MVDYLERIKAMVEGESEEVLKEIDTLLTYHMAFRAGEVDGEMKLKEILEEM